MTRRCEARGRLQQFQQRLPRSVEALFPAVDNAHRTIQLEACNPNGHQPPLRHLFFHHARGHDTDARAVRHRFLDHLNIVEVQRHVYMHVMLTQEAVDVLANGKILVETDEIQTVQVFGSDFGVFR